MVAPMRGAAPPARCSGGPHTYTWSSQRGLPTSTTTSSPWNRRSRSARLIITGAAFATASHASATPSSLETWLTPARPLPHQALSSCVYPASNSVRPPKPTAEHCTSFWPTTQISRTYTCDWSGWLASMRPVCGCIPCTLHRNFVKAWTQAAQFRDCPHPEGSCRDAT